MAISPSSYAVGNRLYKGATSAPTRGRVDPTGYVDRELNKVASRSGIASAALRRMGSPSGTTSTQQQSGATQAAPQSQVGMTGQTKSIGGGLGSSPGLGAALRVSPVGKLAPPQLRSTTDLPFDAEKADAEVGLLAEKNDFGVGLTKARQDLERQYTDSSRQIDQEQPVNQRNLLNNFAGRGMVYSSGYANDFGNLQNEYANMRGRLDQDRTGGIADLLNQEANFNNNYGMKMTAIQQAATRRAAEKAAEIELENKAKMEAHEAQVAADRQAAADAAAAKQAEHAAAQAAQMENPTFVPDLPPAPQGDPNYQPPAGQNQSWYGGGAPRPSYIPSTATFGGGAPAPTPPPTAPTPPPAPPVQQQQPVDLASRPGGTRTMSSFDKTSQAKLAQGGTIVGGNGYTYKYNPLTGQAERVK